MSFVIDLDAERREVQYPHGIPVKFHGEQFLFPAELPAEALDPILSDELDLVGVLGDVLKVVERKGGNEVMDVVTVMFRRPRLPKQFLQAVRETYEVLLEDQYEDFAAKKPSVPDYIRLTTALARVYGVELGKLFGSGDSSETASQTSSPTSPATTTDSTPEASGSDLDSPDSSESAG
ncbi:hypothetical protein ABZ023_18090 [Streptomyces sp. NPDC006367]|uniref:hypothetical protein n=1 Tax=unclassified Streptomyces TaxID=2593676 RepID=UPI0033ACA77E